MAKPTMQCGLCTGQFHFGKCPFGGKYLQRYEIAVCSTCYDGNEDGWAPAHESKLLDHLSCRGLEVPSRNGNGWLARD